MFSCNEKQKKLNVKNFDKVAENDSKQEVISKMELKPDSIILKDTIFWHHNSIEVESYIYKSPHYESSESTIHFDKNGKVVAKHL